MEKGRSSASFDPKDLGTIIYGSKQEMEQAIAAFERVENILGDDNFKLPATYGDLNRQQMLLEGLRAGKATFQDGLKHNHSIFDYTTHLFSLGNANPCGLTAFLFTPFLKLVGTDEQVAHWLPLAESGQIIGSYSQTEMAHGTHVGGIETTATFDRETDEFVIHSPTPTSAKYWPGGIGYSASHTILMARLIIDGNDYGVHPFMVQLRSLEDFKPMPGIEMGDIGHVLKMSYNDTDNGYAIFNYVRIPRTDLLSRHASVSQLGAYTSVPLRDKLVYGGMLNGRSVIVRAAAFQLAQALTIATRYSVVREQGHSLDLDDSGETSIMAYKHQHYRLLTMISQAYAILFAWKAGNLAHADLRIRQTNGDHSTLPYIHALMCSLKAWSTQTAADGAEEARKMCGGHGYLAMSGLPEIVASITATCTFEGENWVMWGQVGRYLLKGMDATTLPVDMAYIDQYCPADEEQCRAKGKDFLDLTVLVEIFKHRAARLIHEAHAKVSSEVGKGMSRAKAQNKFGLELTVAARAHIEVYILEACIQQLALPEETASHEIQQVLRRMISLFGLTVIASPIAPYTATFIGDGYFTYSQIFDMTSLIDDLLMELLPDAVALTDAFCFTDGSLRSVIGCKDGDIYRRLMAWTKQLPINVEARKNGGRFKEGWELYTEAFLKENKGFAGIPVRAKL
ncbi:acyl-CoA oxidase [Mollisia scopiformis]|uniref:Acyl-coenzyme A oxidase n=1 Tax=Mollisia scopiformis TaxID=149040 RepID=A0A194XFX5_MOLSC|nr:acyl-CoA oxidase [Mollisia scopiformis]KUJ19073.1 acyl-CoA oxidase [Mollisia scopiformis]